MAVTDEAIEKIKAMIMSGALRAGDRLPREADLAADLGLSRSSLREAVRALSLVNILDVRRGDGTYVTSLEPRLLLEALSFIVDFHRDDTRARVPPGAAHPRARRDRDGGGADHRGGERGPAGAARQHRAAIRRPRNWSPTTWSFTGGSWPARGTRCSPRCSSRCPGRRPGPGSGAGSPRPAPRARTLAEHRAILDALAAHEPEVARSWATVHIAGVEQWLASVP